jgi:hypothetical protein
MRRCSGTRLGRGIYRGEDQPPSCREVRRKGAFRASYVADRQCVRPCSKEAPQGGGSSGTGGPGHEDPPARLVKRRVERRSGGSGHPGKEGRKPRPARAPGAAGEWRSLEPVARASRRMDRAYAADMTRPWKICGKPDA